MTEEGKRFSLSPDAAVVLALAGAAMEFASSAEDEAERWLRALRMHGRAGHALQALGVGESQLMPGLEPRPGWPPLGCTVVDDALARAQQHAFRRGACAVGTAELLLALMELYGRHFDRALYLRGASREELLERLFSVEAEVEVEAEAVTGNGARAPAPASSIVRLKLTK